MNGVEEMIQIDNKFDVGQKVFYIGRKCKQYGKKKKLIWLVKSKEPVKILCIFYKYKLLGEPDLRYSIETFGKVKEEHIYADYEAALNECTKRNEEENTNNTLLN